MKCSLFSDFHYGFRSSRSTADLLTVVFDNAASAFNRSVAIRGVAFDISKTFDRVLACWSSDRNLSVIEFQVRHLPIFRLF